MVGQFDRLDVAVSAAHDLAHHPEADVNATGSKGVDLGVLHVDSAVEHHGEPAGQLAKQAGGV